MRTGDTNSLLSYIKGSWNTIQIYLYTVNPFASGRLLVPFRIKYFLLHSLTCRLLASLHSPCACLKSPKNPKNPRKGVSCSALLPFIQHAHHDLIGKPTSWVKRAEPYAELSSALYIQKLAHKHGKQEVYERGACEHNDDGCCCRWACRAGKWNCVVIRVFLDLCMMLASEKKSRFMCAFYAHIMFT